MDGEGGMERHGGSVRELGGRSKSEGWVARAGWKERGSKEKMIYIQLLI